MRAVGCGSARDKLECLRKVSDRLFVNLTSKTCFWLPAIDGVQLLEGPNEVQLFFFGGGKWTGGWVCLREFLLTRLSTIGYCKRQLSKVASDDWDYKGR